MRISICLYSQSSPADMPRVIEKCLSLVDHSIPFQVSRTVGPANYYEIERKFQNDEEATDITPKMDVYRREVTNSRQASSLYREGSSLITHFTYCRSEVLGNISKEISGQFEHGFFHSDAYFTFGPTDIIRLFERNDGELDVELVAISMVQFEISSDNFLGDPARLAECLPLCPSFRLLNESLDAILETRMLSIIIF